MNYEGHGITFTVIDAAACAVFTVTSQDNDFAPFGTDGAGVQNPNALDFALEPPLAAGIDSVEPVVFAGVHEANARSSPAFSVIQK